MKRPKDRLIERRKYIRLDAPVEIIYTVPGNAKVHTTTTKNISADGLRLETREKDIGESDVVEIKLNITGAVNPVHAKGKIVWKRKLSLEDAAPFDMGISFTVIEEDNKNTFLKFLCDNLYNLPQETKHGRKSS